MFHVMGLFNLTHDIEKYKQMFPETYTSIDTIFKTLEERENDPVGSIFGVSVADDWCDKCYGFEVDKTDPKRTFFHYAGVWKT